MIKYSYHNDEKYTYEHREILCDTCGKSDNNGELIPIRIDFSYGHSLDGEKYDFCNYSCLLKFIIEEIKKEKKNENNELD